MGRFVQLVMGPAGVGAFQLPSKFLLFVLIAIGDITSVCFTQWTHCIGKSSYCKTMQEHGRATRRTIHVANLDPAAESYGYDASFDIRNLINVDQVMEEHGFGPNGGLVYCMEYLLQNPGLLKYFDFRYIDLYHITPRIFLNRLAAR